MLHKKIIIAVLLAGTLGSCTKNFSTINQNPTAPGAVPLDYLFGQVQLQFAGSAGDPGYTEWRANLIYCMPQIQQMASLGQFYSGDKYLYSATNAASGAYFGTSDGEGNYPNSIKNMVNLLTQARLDSATNTNLLAMTKILWVMQMSAMTDLYGDIPYFQAGLGYLGQNFTPTYDPQSAIYPDMLNLLAQATAGLSTSAAIPSGSDFAYGGNLTYWAHLANSLMLRLGMRLQRVDPTNAQKWVTQALAGGVFASNAETYALQYTGGATYSINANSYNLGPSDGVHRNVVLGGNLQWSTTFIYKMQARQDPRIGQISNVSPTASGTNVLMGDTTNKDQLGLPNGLDNAPGTTNIDIYSTMNPLTFASTAPDIIITYAEVEFLKAEAEARGWVTGNPATEYTLGQAAALNQMVSYNKGFAFTPAQVSAYQAYNPYPTAGGLDSAVSAIQTECWLLWADTYNGYEAWASWRRTGYPILIPVNYPGNYSNGTIPRRLIYPSEEATLDATNYQTAVKRMGGDLFTTKVWWDGGTD
jgi:hypothetical protein